VSAVVNELPVEPTEEEILRQMQADAEAVDGEPHVPVGVLKETPIEKIPEIPGSKEAPELTPEFKAEVEAGLGAAQRELLDFISYLETKYSKPNVKVSFAQNIGFAANITLEG
jgi:hypothetical protein